MKTHSISPIENIELKFVGPAENKSRAIETLAALGFTESSDLLSWEEAFPEYDADELPGVALAVSRTKEDMTQKELSRLTGIPQGHISEMENGKRAIGVKTAKKLAKVLNISYKVFL
jgi:DNA-binding XRE family transcriptional regulator